MIYLVLQVKNRIYRIVGFLEHCLCKCLDINYLPTPYRYRENRHVSMGAEKWLDIELWDSVHECFKVLKSRGYRIATTHLGTDTV